MNVIIAAASSSGILPLDGGVILFFDQAAATAGLVLHQKGPVFAPPGDT